MASQSRWLLLLLSCAVVSEVLGLIMRPSCATGWFYHKNKCYGYFRKLRNWSEAEHECQSHRDGAHLASILNLKEVKAIAKYISGYQRNLPVWIGLHDPLKKQKWQWADGSLYLHKTWSGNPLAGNEHCAELSYRNNFLTWNSSRCNKRQHFLCKYKP
ncbi:regenerating islet-derived protein 4 isoform X2 [Tamandua tetradactyla]|uniref:regenerating islet-derived protein 4 isoform X2 n=1 Tax=Tamandua tetradactyla TaxID=48850 RepID=UPI004054744B